MLRVILTVLLPLAAPFLVYFAWVWLLRRGGTEKDLREAPWVWMLAVGIACSLVGFIYLHTVRSHDPGTKLAPPAPIDGIVVPSHPVD